MPPVVVTVQKIENLVRFLPHFTKEREIFVNHIQEKGCYTFADYPEDVWQFIKIIYDDWFLEAFDWAAWQPQAAVFIEDTAHLATADLETLQKLLTLHVRKERASEGHLATVLASGHIAALLKRLAELKST